MSLVPVALGSAYPVSGYGLPDLISLCVTDSDGTGGTLYLNGQGLVNGSDVFDLKALFTASFLNFVSIPLLARAFKSVPAATGNASALAQFSKYLDITTYPLVGTADPAFSLRFQAITGIMSSATTPFLMILAPAGGEGYSGDTWRLNLRLRHSITN